MKSVAEQPLVTQARHAFSLTWRVEVTIKRRHR
jgi:hypothetical protein